MATYSLVHGAWHGGWCWDRVRAELEAHGHSVAAPDLPCDDPDADFDDYAAVVPPADVVVGHSLGGHTITRVAARVHVFLCAHVPGADESDSEGQELELEFDDRGRHMLRDAAMKLQYPPEDVALASLLRPQTRLPRTPAPPPVDPLYVVCTQDRMVDPSWQRRASASMRRVELDAGHSAMLTHPRELAELLLREAGVV